MKKYISIFLSALFLLPVLNVGAETVSSENDTDAFLTVDVVETVPGDENEIEAESLNISEEIDTWTALGSMQNARAAGEIMSVGGELYAYAGMGETGYINKIEKYDETTNSWAEVTEIPGAPKGFGTAVHDSKIYIVGGYINSGYSDVVQVYDTSSNEWSKIAPMKEKRDQPAVLYVGNKLYVFGGRNGRGFVDSYEYYDFASAEWNKVTTGFPDSIIRVGANAQYINGYICIYGGINKEFINAGVDMYESYNLNNMQDILSSGKYESISISCGSDKALIFAWNGSKCSVCEMAVSDEDISVSDVTFENSQNSDKYTMYAMHSGYLYAAGGYNTQTRKYINDVYKYSVYYGEYAVGDGTINSTVTEDGNSFTLNAEAGREYMLFINASNVTSFDDYTFKIEYTDGAFAVVDGCAMTSWKDTKAENVDGADIEITEILPGGMSFRCTEQLSDKKITKTVNAVLLRANGTGKRTIKYSMVKNNME